MRRYHSLDKKDVFQAMNKLRDAFLAAKDGSEVEKIIASLLTYDERLKIGRRLIIAEALQSQLTIDEICLILHVGKHTVTRIAKELDINDEWYNLISQRSKKVEKEYHEKKYESRGGSTLIHKKKVATGFKRKDVMR